MTMWLKFLILLLVEGALSGTETRFTNIECEMLDCQFGAIRQCELKLLGRGIVGVNVYVQVKQVPITNVKVNLSLWRKFNGYRPFMFNSTFDYCKYMSKHTKKLSFEKIFLDALATKSNLNHTCPYEDDIVVRDLVFKEEYFVLLPLPAGQYKMKLMVAVNNDWKVIVGAHISRKEDLINI